MRRRLARGVVGAAVAVVLSLVLISVAFAAPGSTHGKSDGKSDGKSNRSNVAASTGPVVAKVAPKSGPAAGGTTVTIKGSGFEGATAVAFGTVPATSFAITSDRVITAVAPASTAGQTVHITVTTLVGTSATSASDRYRYKGVRLPGSNIPGITLPAVRNVAPKAGPETGGARVRVTGAGFQDVTAVTFGTVPATAFRVLSTRVIVATSPAGAVGPVNVTVTTAKGTSAISASAVYTYKEVLPPVVWRIAPKTGGPAAGGARVIIIGENFLGVTGVMFGTVPATSFRVLNHHVIVAVSPAGTEGQSVDVTVITTKGTSPISPYALYLYKTLVPSGEEETDSDD
jgi:hypothetical protein